MANTKTSNLNIRIDNQLKSDAEVFFEGLGMSLTTAVNIYFRQCLRENRIPFEITANVTPNATTLAAMMEAERISKDPNVPSYSNVNELFEELKK